MPLKTLPGHTPVDAGVGDLDGDGEYEIVLEQEMKPRDNSQKGTTGETKLDAYRLDGAFLWRINLGRNVRESAHYTPFVVYDLDGDGRPRSSAGLLTARPTAPASRSGTRPPTTATPTGRC